MPEELTESTRRIWYFISIALIIAGICFYWSWGIIYGTWDIFSSEGLGAYVIMVLLVGFGILGAILTRKRR